MIEKVIRNEDRCYKLIELVELLFLKKGVHGDLTNLIKLLMKFLKNANKISLRTLAGIMKVFVLLITEVDDLR